MNDPLYLVSACLAGVNCRYNGQHKLDPRIAKLVIEGRAIAICPEQLGDLPIPRPASNLQGGTGADVIAGTARVIGGKDQDVTDQFLNGAQKALEIALGNGVTCAILKENSPSCGCKRTYVLDANGKAQRVDGMGVAAALLAREGIRVVSEEDLDDQGQPTQSDFGF